MPVNKGNEFGVYGTNYICSLISEMPWFEHDIAQFFLLQGGCNILPREGSTILPYLAFVRQSLLVA